MEFYIPRKLMFKAWNMESKLLMRLDNIGCTRGELLKKDHIILQFTGMTDKQHEEIYEMDLVLIGSVKYVILWSSERNGWSYMRADKSSNQVDLTTEAARSMMRLCSYFESSGGD
jgi:hypothetical protein